MAILNPKPRALNPTLNLIYQGPKYFFIRGLLTFVQCVAGLVLATLCRDFIEEESNDPEVRGEAKLLEG